MICLCLAHPDLETAAATLREHRSRIGLAELRVDCLAPDQHARIPAFLAAMHRELGISFLLTLRLPSDGGFWKAGEEARIALFRSILQDLPLRTENENRAGPVAWVDIEDGSAMAPVATMAWERGIGIIRSFHDFAGTPGDLRDRLEDLGNSAWIPEGWQGAPGALLPKAAVMVRSSADLLCLVRAALERRDRGGRFILAGMGSFGVPSRILSNVLGSFLTYSSPAGAQAAPGHMDPFTLEETYHHSRTGKATRIFGIIANPVHHSRSPAYHNEVFGREGVDAVYVPFQVDDIGAFMDMADLLDLQGFSVTVPHKEGVRAFLASEETAVTRIGACNTVLRTPEGWHGMNTDAPGFTGPLLPLLGSPPAGRKALVIGAGGAGRSSVQALLELGMDVLVVNRTAERARKLADEFARWHRGHIRGAGLDEPGTVTLAEDYRDLVVQTTSAGMQGSQEKEDPFPALGFKGNELVYEIVYVPARTVFLRRAEAAGCRTLNGLPMFQEQARLQSVQFLARAGVRGN